MTWNRFLRIIEIKTKTTTLATLATASLAAQWLGGSVPWYRVGLFAAAALAAEIGFSAFRHFRSEDEGRTGVALVTAMGFLAFSLALGLFLVLWTGPLLALAALSPLWVVLAALGLRPLRRRVAGELLTGFFLGTVVWLAVFLIADPSFFLHWWKVLLYSVPSLLFVAALQVLRNAALGSTRRAGPLALAYPLLAYASWIALGATGLLPWTFLAAGLLGAPLTIPFWRSLFGALHSNTTERIETAGLQMYLVFSLLTVLAWVVAL